MHKGDGAFTLTLAFSVYVCMYVCNIGCFELVFYLLCNLYTLSKRITEKIQKNISLVLSKLFAG